MFERFGATGMIVGRDATIGTVKMTYSSTSETVIGRVWIVLRVHLAAACGGVARTGRKDHWRRSRIARPVSAVDPPWCCVSGGGQAQRDVREIESVYEEFQREKGRFRGWLFRVGAVMEHSRV